MSDTSEPLRDRDGVIVERPRLDRLTRQVMSVHEAHEASRYVRALEAERDRYWQALTDIAGWENWQTPTWREIALKVLP